MIFLGSFLVGPSHEQFQTPAPQAPVSPVVKDVDVKFTDIKTIAQETIVEPEPPVASSGGDIELVVRQAARRYGIDEDYFVKIAKCESTLNPQAVNKNYFENGNPSGLFQHLSGYWPARAAHHGYGGASVFDAEANANVTAAMFAAGQSYMWECK